MLDEERAVAFDHLHVDQQRVARLERAAGDPPRNQRGRSGALEAPQRLGAVGEIELSQAAPFAPIRVQRNEAEKPERSEQWTVRSA